MRQPPLMGTLLLLSDLLGLSRLVNRLGDPVVRHRVPLFGDLEQSQPMLKAFFREPLVHFLLLSGLLFPLYGATGDDSAQESRVIRMSGGQVEQPRAQLRRTWMRPPTAAGLEGLIEQHIRGKVKLTQ